MSEHTFGNEFSKFDFEKVNCLLCRYEKASKLLSRDLPSHVSCKRCGLVYQSPRPTESSMNSYYNSGFWEDRIPESGESEDVVSNVRGEAIIDWTKDLLKNPISVIEVGCGPGDILVYVSKKLKCRGIGIEPSKSQAEFASTKSNLKVFHGTLEQQASHIAKTDLLILSHVLEHFYEPAKALKICFEVLNEDGLIWIEVPNIMNPNPEKNLFKWLSIEHMVYFSLNSLSTFIREAGFEVLRYEEDTFIRLLAKKPRSQEAKKPRSQLSSHDRALSVRYALWRHELYYWSLKILKKLRFK